MMLRITRGDSRGKGRTLPRISMPKECHADRQLERPIFRFEPEICRQNEPELKVVESDHQAACFFSG
ncbi:hypothetical protein ACFL03_05765 [Thermodesulfobacteriota bacterium]